MLWNLRTPGKEEPPKIRDAAAVKGVRNLVKHNPGHGEVKFLEHIGLGEEKAQGSGGLLIKGVRREV